MAMSGLTLYYDQREAGVMGILAGSAYWLNPADTDAMLLGLIEAVRLGHITKKGSSGRSGRSCMEISSGADKDRKVPLEAIDRIVSSPRHARSL